MTEPGQSILTLHVRLKKVERILANIMNGCSPCFDCNGSGSGGTATYFNVLSTGLNTIIDARMIGWDVALIAPDGEHPFSTGFTKLKSSDTITLVTPIPAGRTVTIFLYIATTGPVNPSGGFPYTFPSSFP